MYQWLQMQLTVTVVFQNIIQCWLSVGWY